MKGIYLSLDAVFDSRLGTIMRLDESIGLELVRNGWHQRKSDFIEGIDKAQFDEMYRKHEVETLMASMVTNVFQFLLPQVTELMRDSVLKETPIHQRPILDVNIWPYELNAEEIAYIRSVIYMTLKGQIGVNMINVPLSELSARKCNENYQMMVMYDYHDFLNAQGDEIVRNPCPTLILIAPMVYFNENPETNEEIIGYLKQGINSLALLEASIAPRICLKFINVEVFSLIYPDDRLIENTAVRTTELSIEELEKRMQSQGSTETTPSGS